MAASLLKLPNIAQSQFLTKCTCLLPGSFMQVREASKKAASVASNKKGRSRGKHRSWKKLSGDYVEKGMILFRQFGLKVYPGENVGCGRDFTLFALEAGRVEMTVEKLSPYPNSPLYRAVQSGREVYKQFYHIIPEPQVPKFKLVSQV